MSDTPNASGNAVLVNALSSSMRSTLNGMESVPGLVRQVVAEGSWREFTTPRGERVIHDSFQSFVTTKPTRGLGYSIEELLRLIADDEETTRQVTDLLGMEPIPTITRASSWRDPSDDPETFLNGTIEEPVLDLTSPVDRDAFELRSIGRSGAWLWALKVARNVVLNDGQGKKLGPRNARNEAEGSEKVSAAEFARRIGWSTPRVMRYYRAWEIGVKKHDLPDFDQLTPGVDVPLPESKTWTDCFTPGRVSPDRAEALVASAEEAGLSVREVIYAAKSPGAMKAAILADESTAEAASTAILERARNDSELRIALARTIAHDPVFRKETAVETRKAERADYVRQVADDGKVKTPAGQVLELAEEAKLEAVKLLVVVNDPQATPEEITEAYDRVQALTVKAVEADPDVQIREHRTRLFKVLTSTTKSVQGIDPDDLAAFADDELRAKLTDLQNQINELASLVAKK